MLPISGEYYARSVGLRDLSGFGVNQDLAVKAVKLELGFDGFGDFLVGNEASEYYVFMTARFGINKLRSDATPNFCAK
jgi:hypothetical protein